ncbi:MAG: twin-arginine translocation signal domain-containing protein, partial [Candidatus Omnitrophica bacterium]|nr:twin-arginine translocation signal domain-containing protein [Candidatus Omnitrophota bacterium]
KQIRIFFMPTLNDDRLFWAANTYWGAYFDRETAHLYIPLSLMRRDPNYYKAIRRYENGQEMLGVRASLQVLGEGSDPELTKELDAIAKEERRQRLGLNRRTLLKALGAGAAGLLLGGDSEPNKAARPTSPQTSAQANQKAATPGGIDFNPAKMPLNVIGEGTEFPVAPNGLPLSPDSIKGFVPIIINIQPLKSLPALLGQVAEPFSVTSHPS